MSAKTKPAGYDVGPVREVSTTLRMRGKICERFERTGLWNSVVAARSPGVILLRDAYQESERIKIGRGFARSLTLSGPLTTVQDALRLLAEYCDDVDTYATQERNALPFSDKAARSYLYDTAVAARALADEIRSVRL